MKVTNLKVLHVNNPLGIDRMPYFSWILESDLKNTVQTTYEIVVKDENNKIFWNSGIVKSEQNSFIHYKGEKLSSCTGFIWSVRVVDNYGNVSEECGTFSTAFLESPNKATSQCAKWISTSIPGVPSRPGFGNQPPAIVFRRSFHIGKIPVKAILYITSCGAYEFTLNGGKTDDRFLATEYSSFPKVHFYQTYDLTSFIISGQNILDITVADGWFCCPKTQLDAKIDKQRAVLYKLQLVYPDGNIEWINSDEQTVSSESPVRAADIFSGELYDAAYEISQKTKWNACVSCEYPYDNLKAQIGEGVHAIEVLQVKRKYTSPKGETILDFGQNIAGVVRFRSHLKKGERLTLDHFETPDKEGNYFNTIAESSDVGKNCEQRTVFISDGREAIYTPHFTYQGFRYVRVTGPEAYEIKTEDFEALALSSYKKSLGEFSCSDERINRLYQNTLWSQRANTIAIPTDCPQREKAGWTGDIAIYAKTALQNEDATAFLSRWLLSLSAEQRTNGAVPIVVPFSTAYQDISRTLGKIAMNKGDVGSSGWGDAAVLVPWAMYEITGNTDILSEQYDSMKKWCDYIITSAKRRGSFRNPSRYERYLLNTGFHFGDWLVPSLAKNGYDFNLVKAVIRTRGPVASLFSYHTICLMCQIANLVENQEDETYYREIAEHMKEAIRHTLIPKRGRLKHEFMGIYVLMLAFDVVPEDQISQIGDQLLRMLDENDGCLDTGFLGTPWLLDALCKCGHTDRAYALLMQEKCPSWLYEVKMGATTIWESWFSYDKQEKPLKVSFNHYAFGCVDDWIFRYIGGIFPKSPGFKRVLIKVPKEVLAIGITSAQRSFLSENGLIKCEWKADGNKLHLNVNIPCNTTADICLWDGTNITVGSGEYHFG